MSKEIRVIANGRPWRAIETDSGEFVLMKNREIVAVFEDDVNDAMICDCVEMLNSVVLRN